MHKIDDATAALTQPAIQPVGPNPNGWFRPENELLGQEATIITVDWLNAIQAEISNVITDAGLSLSKTTQNQLSTAIQTLIGNAIAGLPGTVIKTITQNGHGFSVNDQIYYTGSNWALARANSLSTSWNVGMVYEVQSTNVFKLLMFGFAENKFTGLTPGTTYYLSTSVAGDIQATRPSSDGTIIKPLLYATTATSGFYVNGTPIPYGAGGGGSGDLLAANNLSDLDDIPTARTNLGLGSAALSSSADFATSTDMTTAQEDIAALQTDLADYATTAYVDGEISTVSGDISALGTTVTALSNTVDGITDDITAIETSLDGKQPLDATLTAFGGLTFAANQIAYATGSDAFATSTLTAFARTLLDDADAGTARATLGLGTAAQSAASDFASSTDFTALDGRVSDAETAIAGLDTDLDGKQPLDATLTALAGTVIAANKLPYGDGSDSFATTDFTAFARSILDDSDAATVRTTLGLAIGTNVQAYHAILAALAGLTIAADSLPYGTGTNTFSTTTLSSFARTLIDDADASTARTTLGVAIGSDVQAYSAALASIAGLTTTADRMIYTTASNTYAVTNLTSFGRTLAALADASAGRTALGLVIGTNVQAWSADLDDLVDQYFPATSGNPANMHWHEATSNGGNRVNVKAPVSLAGNVDITWPSADGIVLVDANIGSTVQAHSSSLDSVAAVTVTSAGTALLDDADASAQRTTLGLTNYATFAWSGISSNTSLVANNGYYITSGGALTLALPATAAVGTIIEVCGYGSTSWQITQASGQSIWFNNTQTTAGTGGSITSGTAKDCIRILCVVANTTWVTLSSTGFPDVV